MKIVIDARMYGLEHAGIGRYIMNLINQIEKKDKENDYFILLREKYFRDLKFKNPRFKKILAEYSHYSFREQFLLPLQLIKLKPDLVHFPHFNVPLLWWGRQVITIHDLIKHESRGSETTTRWQPFYWFKYLVYKFIVWVAVKRAVKIIVPSKWWRDELARRYRLGPNKIAVTYEAVDEKFLEPRSPELEAGKILAKYKIKKPFAIYTGSLYPHKNVERLVKAVKKINLRLVIVCARSIFLGKFRKRIKDLKAENLVTLAGFVPDEELVSLYQEAEAFVFPSLLEGFGLPGLEAMAVGLPVIASNASCLPEIYGDAALYFDPENINDMAEKIKKVVDNQELRERLKKLGFEQVRKYSWQRMAKETLEIYKETVAER